MSRALAKDSHLVLCRYPGYSKSLSTYDCKSNKKALPRFFLHPPGEAGQNPAEYKSGAASLHLTAPHKSSNSFVLIHRMSSLTGLPMGTTHRRQQATHRRKSGTQRSTWRSAANCILHRPSRQTLTPPSHRVCPCRGKLRGLVR